MPTPAQRPLTTTAPAAVILIRLMVGGIFLSEGIQKFLYPGAIFLLIVGAGKWSLDYLLARPARLP